MYNEKHNKIGTIGTLGHAPENINETIGEVVFVEQETMLIWGWYDKSERDKNKMACLSQQVGVHQTNKGLER